MYILKLNHRVYNLLVQNKSFNILMRNDSTYASKNPTFILTNILTNGNIAIRKKYSQNFLINSSVIDRIIDYSEIQENDLVLEIGCGLGNLTHKLIEKKINVIGFEIDRAYIKNLRLMFGKYNNFKLIEGDFLLNINKNNYNYDNFNRIFILGNIPYNITSQILEKIFMTPIYFDVLIFMLSYTRQQQ